jgi:LuxR family transcriptional regulator of csgAB operon
MLVEASSDMPASRNPKSGHTSARMLKQNRSSSHFSADENMDDNKSPSGKKIYVLTVGGFQTELFVSYLHEKTGADCIRINKFDDLDPEVRENGTYQRLILWDCSVNDPEKGLKELTEEDYEKLSNCLLCLFKVPTGRGIEYVGMRHGVRGFFYEDDSLEQIIKGICLVFAGELWVSRKVMTECILSDRVRNDRRVSRESFAAHLTQREAEILNLLAVGYSNESIGERLFISPHTVKTHLYNIFKKINVPNRLQAALWAAKYL